MLLTLEPLRRGVLAVHQIFLLLLPHQSAAALQEVTLTAMRDKARSSTAQAITVVLAAAAAERTTRPLAEADKQEDIAAVVVVVVVVLLRVEMVAMVARDALL